MCAKELLTVKSAFADTLASDEEDHFHAVTPAPNYE
jgi:hypothetical protein